jgi:predicted lipoprotein with Yx(FWY)xxD motif
LTTEHFSAKLNAISKGIVMSQHFSSLIVQRCCLIYLVLFAFALSEPRAAVGEENLCKDDVASRGPMLGTWKSRTSSGSAYNIVIARDGDIKFATGATLVGKLEGHTFTGCWIRQNKIRYCRQTYGGSRYWGRVVFTFDETFQKFTGRSAACDDKPVNNWDGTLVAGTDQGRTAPPAVVKTVKPVENNGETPPEPKPLPPVTAAPPQSKVAKAYHAFFLRRQEPEFCRSACIADSACKTWVFVPARLGNRAQARCRLHNENLTNKPVDGILTGKAN